jgi:hypothetical protein
MKEIGIEPVFPPALPEIAEFLFAQRAAEAATLSGGQISLERPADIGRRLQWLLLDNPSARHGEPIGLCLRDGEGVIRGLNLCFPASFSLGNKKIAGLGSGSFFVDPNVKSLGFFLFRKYLACPGYAFYFATTCNAASAPLWKALGGRDVMRSEVEFVIPLQLDSMAALWVARKNAGGFATEIARWGGRCASPMLNIVARPRVHFDIKPCHDWEKLADLSRRCTSQQTLTSDRSADLLRWRYGPSSPMRNSTIYLISDSRGNEGWFALSDTPPRAPGKVRGCTLLDAIWPEAEINFRDILPRIAEVAPAAAEAVFIRCRADQDLAKAWRWFVLRRLAVPRAYVITAKGNTSLDVHSLDYDDNDYVAWS